MNTIWTKAFWKGAGERAIKSAAQSLTVVWGANGVGVLDTDWKGTLSLTGGYVLASIMTSIGNADFTAGYAGNVVPIDAAPAA